MENPAQISSQIKTETDCETCHSRGLLSHSPYNSLTLVWFC